MRKSNTFRVGVASALLGFIATAPAVANPLGVWNTEGGKGQVEITECGAAFCGNLVWSEEAVNEDGTPKLDANNPDPELQDRELIGVPIVWDMQPTDGAKEWRDGRVYDPENGKTYKAQMHLEDADTLKLRGYVGVPMFGRTSTWTRAEAINE